MFVAPSKKRRLNPDHLLSQSSNYSKTKFNLNCINSNELFFNLVPIDYSTPSTSTDVRSEGEPAGMGKRRSALRRTIAGPEDLNLNEKLCVLCGGNYRSMVIHYAREHSDCGIFISRPSPEMVDLIKQQKLDEFTYDESSNKIKGMCYFCEEQKPFLKFSWQRHLLTHRGCYSLNENIYEIDDNNGNDSTNKEPEAKKDYPLRCYICNHCNYTQFNE